MQWSSLLVLLNNNCIVDNINLVFCIVDNINLVFYMEVHVLIFQKEEEKQIHSMKKKCWTFITVLRPSQIFFVAFFSVTVDGRNLIFGHKLHIGTPYRGKRFWTHQIPTSCLPTLLIFIHIDHYMLIFRCIFLSHYWWQKSDI